MIEVPAAAFAQQKAEISNVDPIEVYGKVKHVVGIVVESSGPESSLGDICSIELGQKASVPAEVVGFRENRVLLMPFGEMTGIQSGCRVRNTRSCLKVPTGAQLLGRVLNGLGAPIDGLGPIDFAATYPVYSIPPEPLSRKLITEPLPVGIRAIDALITCGAGQRIGIFAGSGVGKSTVLGMIAKNTRADVNVIALVGERGREVREFIENDLGTAGLERSVVVVATSEQPALVRIKAAFTATAIAESFRDLGLNVMLIMDSVTRFAMAQREVGLATGEPPSTKGYTPSVFALLPRLMERAGNSDKGGITGMYAVLVEGDDTNEPIADATRAILDGHVILDRKLANSGHYPAIDVGASLSRVMPLIADPEHIRAANRLRELISAYRDVEELVAIGAYQQGSKPTADEAIAKWERIQEFLRQDRNEADDYSLCVAAMMEIVNGEV